MTAQRAGNAAVIVARPLCMQQPMRCHAPEKNVLTNSAGSLEFAPLLQRGDFFGSRQREEQRHHRRTRSSNEGVDGLEKSGIIGGSQRRKAFGSNDEAA
ncbi:hypothetical protein, partial [Stenotrophomonas indicatrix]|uniref:hypothetical protein n=1 Tax=Stenotrophomonas indicatrix TaxID=2045451 RepID=UPI00289D4E5F